MLIVIEGADGTGKSTLANAIAHAAGPVEVIHAGPPARHPLIEYTSPLAGYRPAEGHTVVCDRWHLGELVYGHLYRGGSGLTADQFRGVEDFLLELGAVLVYCTGSSHYLAKQLRERGEAPNEVALGRELARFQEVVMNHSRLPRLVSVAGISYVTAEEVVDFARHMELEAAVA